MSQSKFSVIILGQGESLKTALITNITGKDLSKLSKTVKTPENIVIYENEKYRFIQTPDFKENCEHIKKIFSEQPIPDIGLLVVEDGFSEDANNTIQNLSKITERPLKDFRVVLPLKHTANQFNVEQLVSELEKLAEEKHLTSMNSRPESKLTPQNKDEVTGFGHEDERNRKRKHSDSKVNLLLVGMAGTGKSASGNTILGKKVFKSRPSSTPITSECQKEETESNGLSIRVIDTPDMFDDEMNSTVKNQHLKKCRELCESDPCVYVLVMHVSRFTDGEKDMIKKLEKMFGINVSEQTVVLFTRGNDLVQSGMSFKDFLGGCQPKLKKLVQKCGNRCVLFENNNLKSDQVETLMELVNNVHSKTCIRSDY